MAILIDPPLWPRHGRVWGHLVSDTSLAELHELVGMLDPDAEFPVAELGTPRGRQGSPRGKVVLPHGWYDDTSGCELDLAEAELDVSGG